MEEALRQLVRQRAGNRCEYSLIPQHALAWSKFHTEHIRARQHGGASEVTNLALARRFCNLHKGPNLTSIDPESDRLVPLFNPRVDEWIEHFALNELQIVGLTDVGRTTVSLLNMNDPERIQVRAELIALNEW